MQPFRTTNRSGRPKSVCRWLAIALLVGGLAPTFAQNNDGSTASTQVSAAQARGVAVSGLGEQKLSKRFPDAALWLDLDSGARALAMLWPGREASVRGGLIILADEGGNAESGLTGTLARELASRNFAVLTLGLESPSLVLEGVLEGPVEPEGSGPAPGDRNSNAISPATIDVMASETGAELEAAYRERIREQLVAGVLALEERDQKLVAVLGIGRGSNHVALNAAELGGSPAMIWVSPSFYPKDVSELLKTLDEASVPRILELSSSDKCGQRRAGLIRPGVEGFNLQFLGSGDLSSPQHGRALAGRISAWLKPGRP